MAFFFIEFLSTLWEIRRRRLLQMCDDDIVASGEEPMATPPICVLPSLWLYSKRADDFAVEAGYLGQGGCKSPRVP